jgi:hypothetical protein
LLGILIAGSPRLRQRIKLRFLLIIVRFERIVQFIEEDRQVAVTLAQRGRRFQPRLRPQETAPASVLINELLSKSRYIQDISISSRSVAEELAEPEDWLASIQPELIPL